MNTETTSTALAIASSAENVGMIIRNTPENFSKNQLSCSRCLSAGEKLLEEIKGNGMTDELDQTVAKYIDKTRRTLKEMNERRSPITKLFDQVRKEFTGLENDIDPTKSGTIPFQLQQLRNQYADRKRKEEEERRRAEEVIRQAEIACTQYRAAIEEDYRAWFDNHLMANISRLTDLNISVTLDTYQEVFDTVAAYPSELSRDLNPSPTVRMPLNISPGECAAIRDEVLQALYPGFRDTFRKEIGEYRRDILDRMPSKKTELERAAKADALEAERIRQEISKREQAEQARIQAQQAARQTEEAKKAEVLKANNEAASLFDLSRTDTPAYHPKAKVTKKIRVITPEGYLQIMMMWWAKEGCTLTKEELDKAFKKQISFCEKIANKDSEFINDPSLEYYDDVKAQ